MNSTTNPTGNPPRPNPPAAPPSWPDPNFTKNQAQVPLSELQQWADRHVAWTRDGTRIVAGAETLNALFDELDRLGIDSGTVVFDYIEIPGATDG